MFKGRNSLTWWMTILFISLSTNKATKESSSRSLMEINEVMNSCAKGPIKLWYSYASGEPFEFKKKETSVSSSSCNSEPLINILEGNGEMMENLKTYLVKIIPYVIFVVFGIILLICWFFYCSCCCCPCCCCRQTYEDYYVRKVSFVISILCYAGVIMACITGFVYSKRFLRAWHGTTCTFGKFYYDIADGQSKTNTPKWIGFEETINKIDGLFQFLEDSDSQQDIDYNINNDIIAGYYTNFPTSFKDEKTIQDESSKKINETNFLLGNITEAFKKIKDKNMEWQTSWTDTITNVESFQSNLETIKTGILENWNTYHGYINDYGDWIFKIILSIFFVFAFVTITLLVLYVFTKHQKPIRIILHFIWNIVTFLTFISFILGFVFGVLNVVIKDGIDLIQFTFGEENLASDNPVIITQGEASKYLNICINQNGDIISELGLNENGDNSIDILIDQIYTSLNSLIEIQKNIETVSRLESAILLQKQYSSGDEEYKNLKDWISSFESIFKCEDTEKENKCADSCIEKAKDDLNNILTILNDASGSEGAFSFLNCKFMSYDINLLLDQLNSVAFHAGNFCAIIWMVSFLESIGVYCLLLTIFRYDWNMQPQKQVIELVSRDEANSLLKKQNLQLKEEKLRLEMQDINTNKDNNY